MIMEVISEGLDMRDHLLHSLRGQMAGKQDFSKLALRETVRMTLLTKCDISNLSSGCLLDALNTLQL